MKSTVIFLCAASLSVFVMNGMNVPTVEGFRSKKLLEICATDESTVVSDNDLKEFIDTVRDRESIKHVEVYFSITQESMPLFAIFPNLEILDLSNTQLDSINGIQALSHLRILDVSHNNIKTLRLEKSWDSMFKKIKINFLNISHNKLENLNGINDFDIYALDMSNNRVTNIACLTDMIGDFWSFNMDNNPIHKEHVKSLLNAALYEGYGYPKKNKTQEEREVQIYLIQWLVKDAEQGSNTLVEKRKALKMEIEEKKCALKKIKVDLERIQDESAKMKLLFAEKATELKMIKKFEKK